VHKLGVVTESEIAVHLRTMKDLESGIKLDVIPNFNQMENSQKDVDLDFFKKTVMKLLA